MNSDSTDSDDCLKNKYFAKLKKKRKRVISFSSLDDIVGPSAPPSEMKSPPGKKLKNPERDNASKLPPVKLVRVQEGSWKKKESSASKSARPVEPPIFGKQRLNNDLSTQEAAKLVPVQLRPGVISKPPEERTRRQWNFQDGTSVEMLNGRVHKVINWVD